MWRISNCFSVFSCKDDSDRRMKRASSSCCIFVCVVLAAAYLKYRRYCLSCLPFAWHLFHWHTHTHACARAHFHCGFASSNVCIFARYPDQRQEVWFFPRQEQTVQVCHWPGTGHPRSVGCEEMVCCLNLSMCCPKDQQIMDISHLIFLPCIMQTVHQVVQECAVSFIRCQCIECPSLCYQFLLWFIQVVSAGTAFFLLCYLSWLFGYFFFLWFHHCRMGWRCCTGKSCNRKCGIAGHSALPSVVLFIGAEVTVYW